MTDQQDPKRASQEAAPNADEASGPWVYSAKARKRLGVGDWTWNKWQKAGLIRCGVPVTPGGRNKKYPLDILAREIDAARIADAKLPDEVACWIDEKTARKQFNIGTWKWGEWRKAGKLDVGQAVPLPGGGQTKLYPPHEIRRLVEAWQQFPPPGMLTAEQAAKRFGVSPVTFKQWVTHKKVTCGQLVAKPEGGACHVFPNADIERLHEQLRGDDAAYWDPKSPGSYRIPDGMVRKQDAYRMFGVNKPQWQRWEREKQITCGKRVHAGGPKLYPLAELHRLLDDFGRYAPPYVDPDNSDIVRVPISGQDIRRKEALIDAADLHLVEGTTWNWYEGRHRDGTPNPAGGHVARGLQDDKTSLHRVILGITDPSLNVSHLNDDPLDCRRANLVARTFSQRSGAMRKPRTYHGRPCTSRFKGVCWDKCREKWLVQIKVRGVHRVIGRFDCEIAAAQAYDEAALEGWGEHARINFPSGIDAGIDARLRLETITTDRAAA